MLGYTDVASSLHRNGSRAGLLASYNVNFSFSSSTGGGFGASSVSELTSHVTSLGVV